MEEVQPSWDYHAVKKSKKTSWRDHAAENWRTQLTARAEAWTYDPSCSNQTSALRAIPAEAPDIIEQSWALIKVLTHKIGFKWNVFLNHWVWGVFCYTARDIWRYSPPKGQLTVLSSPIVFIVFKICLREENNSLYTSLRSPTPWSHGLFFWPCDLFLSPL